jgi:hypothetical protein
MCFNAQVSASAYVIGVLGSLMLFRRGRIPEAIFYFWVVQMQLIEYILWLNQGVSEGNPSCGVINETATKLGVCINHLEPIVLWIAIKMFSPKKLPVYIDVIMMVFLCLTVLYTRGVFKNSMTNSCTTVTLESSPHLHWKWTQGSYGREYYLVFLCVLVMLSLYGLPHGRINAVMIITSFLISYKLYGKTHSVGAMWCFSASFAPWILLAVKD